MIVTPPGHCAALLSGPVVKINWFHFARNPTAARAALPDTVSVGWTGLLLASPDHVTSIIPSAMMEVVEMSRLAEARGVKVPDQSHLVTEAQELARQLGDSFVCVTNEKLKQIDATCEMLRKKKRKG